MGYKVFQSENGSDFLNNWIFRSKCDFILSSLFPRTHIDHPTSHLLQTPQTRNLWGISLTFYFSHPFNQLSYVHLLVEEIEEVLWL